MKSARTPIWRIVRTGAPVDAVDYAQRSNQAGAAIASTGGATLLAVNDGGQVKQYVITSGRNGARTAGTIASAVGGSHVSVGDGGSSEEEPELDITHVEHLVARPQRSASHETQSGATPAQVAQAISQDLAEGCWLAVAMREPSKREIQRARRWYQHRLGGTATHHVLGRNVVAVSMYAGGPDRASIDTVLEQASSAMPGFDVESDQRPVPGPGARVGACAAAIVLALAWLFVGKAYANSYAGTDVAKYFPDFLAYGLASVAAALALGWMLGLLPTPRRRLLRGLDDMRFPMPSRAAGRVRAPRKERTVTNQNGTRTIREFEGDYPMATDVFMVGPSVVLGVVNPHIGSAGGEATTKMRTAPKVLTGLVGPLIGHIGGVPIHLSQAARFSGVAAVGEAGSGKSVLVQNVAGFDAMLRVRGRAGEAPLCAGDTGANTSMIVFENKGYEGVAGYAALFDAVGDKYIVVDAADNSTPAIDLFTDESPQRAASKFVDAMVYAFGEVSISYKSQSALRIVFEAALHATDADLVNSDLSAGMSVMEIADVLVTNRGDAPALKLSETIVARCSHPNATEEERDMAARLRGLFPEKVTPSRLDDTFRAPKTKVEVLMQEPGWWARSRPRGRWATILRNHQNVIINTGPSLNGDATNAAFSEHLLSMMMVTLRNAVQETCTGWQKAGRSVNLYADELKLLAGAGDGDSSIIEWFRDQGRSLGVRAVFATQRMNQLAQGLREALLSFGSIVWFRQQGKNAVGAAIEDMTAGGSHFEPAEVTTLTEYHSFVRATAGGNRVEPVPVKMAYWGDRLDSFAADQTCEGV